MSSILEYVPIQGIVFWYHIAIVLLSIYLGALYCMHTGIKQLLEEHHRKMSKSFHLLYAIMTIYFLSQLGRIVYHVYPYYMVLSITEYPVWYAKVWMGVDVAVLLAAVIVKVCKGKYSRVWQAFVIPELVMLVLASLEYLAANY